MKKVLILLMLITSSGAFAQGFGVKAGLNYGDNGDVEFSDITNAGDDMLTEEGDSKVGYHFGVFYRAELGPIFLKPELLYTQTKSSYNFQDENADYELSKLDLPVLVGLEVLGPVNVFAGPSLQYILENDLAGLDIEDVENKFTIGAQFGVGVQFSGIGLDVRYERALSENQAEIIGLGSESSARIDTRPDQIIFSLSLNM